MDARHDADFWIAHLDLAFHPEGGYFKESFRSSHNLGEGQLGAHYPSDRVASTAIYFLVTADRPSRFHRLKTDEIWHFYAGDPLEICCLGLDAAGCLEVLLLGADIAGGCRLQICVPAGTWFGARVQAGGDFALCGCTMAPGFDFEDFEMGAAAELLASFPAGAAIVQALT
jgi:uncharacterized protein